ncbi:dihydrofolate reductase family protein [Antrihabitans sp. YC3-6]|jgi:dihydrofolate reductase|uniref:Dihydrofolate reductase family protein n=1 Tax=Antrihabitans stalagmiti TaxID=2799499 RepID=A0A934U2F1_9NOCA|nr:dihydrofolate reductase family protein [Antrihabitans stalagmiti]MBJ8339164.1 dihydrofolate reductase family protein [Antrihabitans stalagmiti]
MRKIISSLFVSADGVAEAPDTWHFPYFNDEMGAAIGAAMATSDAMLLGRVQYEEFASHWPTSDDEFADFMNNQKKYVVTNTLTEASWNNTEIVSGDALTSVEALKKTEGQDIAITGSLTLVQSLLRAGLLDQLQLFVHPIVVGKGARWFDKLDDTVELTLASAETFSTGVINQIYAPAE